MKSNMIQLMAQNNLLSYCISQDQNFETPAHLKKLARYLEEVESGKIKRLIVCMPPRHGKSFLSTQYFPTWFLGKNPNKKIISASYSASLSTDFGRKVKNTMLSEEYLSIFPNSKISQDSHSASKLSLESGGEYFAVGAEGTLTGRGGDLIIIDDLLKNAEDARSITHQKKIIEWYQTTLLTRLMSGGAIVIVMTRWSSNDIVGWLLDNDKTNEWTTLIMSSLSDDNQPLWPEKFNLESLLTRKQEMGSKMFEALYQQRPNTEEGNIIRREHIQYHSEGVEQMDQIVISIDTTFSNNRNSDYCVMSVIGYKYKTGEYFLIDIIRKKMNFTEAYQNIILLSKKYNKAQFLIEKSANGFALYEMLKNTNILAVQVTPVGSKQDRLYNLVPHFESKKINFLDPNLHPDISDCIEEIVSFPYSKNDDFCDSFAQGIIYLTKTKAFKYLHDLKDYDFNGNPINQVEEKFDVRKLAWPDHDWELEDFNTQLTPND